MANERSGSCEKRGEKPTECCVFYVIGRLLLGEKQGNGHGRRKFGGVLKKIWHLVTDWQVLVCGQLIVLTRLSQLIVLTRYNQYHQQFKFNNLAAVEPHSLFSEYLSQLSLLLTWKFVKIKNKFGIKLQLEVRNRDEC